MAIIPNQKFRFLGGEVSPNLYHSADMDQYGRWFSKAENIRFDTLGAFRNRTGFEKIAETKVSNGTAIKLLSFNFSKDESYLIEMGPTYFRFFEDGVPVYVGGDPDNGVYEVSHTMTITDGDIKYAQSGDVMYIVNGVDPIATLTRNDDTGYNWTFAAFKFKDDCPPLDEINTTKTKTLSISNSSGTYTVTSTNHNFFASKAVGDVFAVYKDMEPDNVKFDGGTSAVGVTTDIITCNGTFSIATTGSWQGAVGIEYSLDGSTNWKRIYTLRSSNRYSPRNINTVINIKTDSAIVYVRGKVISALSHVTDKTNGDDWEHTNYQLELYMTSERFAINSYYKITAKNSGSNATCSCVKNPYIASGGNDSGIYDWYNPAFSTQYGYPSVVGFYQNRLFFGKEYYLYGSKTNNFDDFYTPTTVSADDPVTMSLLSYRYNRIKNILTVRKFFVFSEEGEFGIQSQAALTQTDKNLIPLSYHGSNDCLPILAGNLALFVDQTGNCIRLFQYSYETDMFEANDASVFLEQLLKGRAIVTTDHLKKSKEALFLDDLGTIWVFKVMPEQEVYAWSHIKYATSGKITNMRVVANGADEDLYIAVEDTNLGTKRIEKLTKDKFFDTTKTYTSELRTNRFYTDFSAGTELLVEYENGKSKVIVQDNGLIVLPEQVYSIDCHYIYTSQATLLSPATNLTEGVFTTYNKGKPFKVYFCYQDSYGFKVGVEEEEKMIIHFNNGDRPDSSDLTTGKRNVIIPAKYDGSSRVTFIQDRPYNMSINNILIDMDYGGK